MAVTPTVLYENDSVLVLDKPAGMHVHPTTADMREATITDWLHEHRPALRDVGEPQTLQDGTRIARPGIVHRLDRETSGVLVVAKTQATFEQLKAAFQAGTVYKTYLTFLEGIVRPPRGRIDRAIGRSAKDFRLRSAQRGARGRLREAVTEYAVRLASEYHQVSYVAMYPRTGRTHQIRVHAKAIHHPVICDQAYAPNTPCRFGFQRLALHAAAITVPADVLGRQQTFESPLPSDFQYAYDTVTAS